MSKPPVKSNEKLNTIDELALMRMEIKAMRGYLNDSLDALLDKVDRLIPPEDQLRYTKYKNYSKKDWHDFLDF